MSSTKTQSFPLFGYELIRDHVLSSVLGKNEEDILYWCGKELARKFPLYSMEEAISFFHEAGWGDLTIVKQSKDETFYALTGDPEIMQFEKRCFRLESGFLAQQQQKISGYLTECYDEKKSKRDVVSFQVKWDLKDHQ
ncbi:YslB family protein [Viridibacillus sp. YIM B01967]|uniref:YslB family protein n=1 Tax=Viridibacillus soli TaxID=2798301 RepID=A0ABS1H267_9BACL|nr:YslB family protein [Viridibacillus soli]MBK3493501.1 YslB family protein [Viridibacillus soli]